MRKNYVKNILYLFSVFKYLGIVRSQLKGKTNYVSCQQSSTSGRSYVGEANTTIDGIPCQRWSDTQPHDHGFTHVGDHNFCRNPNGASHSKVWCYTTDPAVLYQSCSVPFCPPLKALDFSLDNDYKPDENNSYTYASIQKENLPSFFTICTAFMVEAWAKYMNAVLFSLPDDNGVVWYWVVIRAFEEYTEFSILFRDLPDFQNQSVILLYPLQWTRVCVSKDSKTSIVRLVVDGELLVENEVKVKDQPANLHLVLGSYTSPNSGNTYELPGKTTNLNIFSTALTVDEMKSITRVEEAECGLEGDFLSWEKSLEEKQWTLHSKARWVNLDGGLEGPCRAKAKMNVFPINEDHHYSDCMKHCEKLKGRSPSVKKMKEWENVLKEVKAVSPDPTKLPNLMWLSATEGDIGGELGKLDHWPEGVEAEEGVWRDYYTGEKLENYPKPWFSPNGDREVADNYNCIFFYSVSKRGDTRTWRELQCQGHPRSCPCSYDSPPLIHLRGFCPESLVEHYRYTMTQSAADPSNIIIIGRHSARIQYNSSFSQWVYTDPRLNVAARLTANPSSFVLGKHSWTISGDRYQCSEGKEYKLEIKLTACNNNEFTCDDGQCVKMRQRCNQVPDCDDKSDELNCKILALKKGYNKRVPPVGTIGGRVKRMKPVEVKVSLTLFKVVAIEEENHSLQLQFQIHLEWKENRATYYNLKSESYLNALSQDEIDTLWLPLVVYVNTDQQETTRLGWVNEWSTD